MVRASAITLAVDTRHGKTASYAVGHGARVISDVSGCSDPEMARLLRNGLPNDVYFVAMHSLTVPADPNIIISGDPIEEILSWIHRISRQIISNGLSSDRLIIDPGIGFGKNTQQSLSIIGSLERIRKEGGFPVYVGYSRKSCLAFSPDQHPADRDLETHVITGLISQSDVAYIRVHDVSGTRRAIEVARKFRSCMSDLSMSSAITDKSPAPSHTLSSLLISELFEVDASQKGV
jgi:dihydropteroate synthase